MAQIITIKVAQPIINKGWTPTNRNCLLMVFISVILAAKMPTYVNIDAAMAINGFVTSHVSECPLKPLMVLTRQIIKLMK